MAKSLGKGIKSGSLTKGSGGSKKGGFVNTPAQMIKGKGSKC